MLNFKNLSVLINYCFVSFVIRSSLQHVVSVLEDGCCLSINQLNYLWLLWKSVKPISYHSLDTALRTLSWLEQVVNQQPWGSVLQPSVKPWNSHHVLNLSASCLMPTVNFCKWPHNPVLTPTVNHVLFEVLTNYLVNNQVTNCASPPLIPSFFTIRIAFVYLHQLLSHCLRDLTPQRVEAFYHCGLLLTWAWGQDSFKGCRSPLHLYQASVSAYRTAVP